MKNIQLPYKTTNEPASHGYVSFKIKPRPRVVIGDSLNNKAAIYFDFNRANRYPGKKPCCGSLQLAAVYP
jgi:hypothetical protein